MKSREVDIVVIGAGPGGYAAAFYAADLGRKVLLIERDELGGVCLNRGCIPSKALLHATEVMSEAKESEKRGISFSSPTIDLNKLRTWKNDILKKLSSGVGSLAKARGVEVLKARAVFDDNSTLRVETENGQEYIKFEKAIIAVGSRPALPGAFDLGSKRIMTSTEALEVEDIPEKLLVIGGGYIGMELGTVYAKLGSEVVVVEAMKSILAGADPDLARPVKQFAQKNFKEVMLNAKVTKMASKDKQIQVQFELENGKSLTEQYDKVLVSVGRTPNSNDLGLENTTIQKDERGYIVVNEQQQTSVPSIYAVGDIAGGILLAHKASKEARTAVESIFGKVSTRKALIPAVVFTDPEVAWVGLTEEEAKTKGIQVEVSKFPWGASGRALTLDRTDGLTKLIIEPTTGRLLGIGMVGVGAGDMISEGALAIEMGATVEDLALTVHPHPTLSETLMESAEAFLGHATHIRK